MSLTNLTPWYGTDNMETGRRIVTGSSGGALTTNPDASDAQKRLWDHHLYVELHGDHGIVSRRFAHQIPEARRLLGRNLKIEIVD